MVTGITAGEAFVRILADTTKLQQGLKRAEARFKAFGASVQAVGAKVAAIGAVMTAPFIAAAKVFANAGDELDKMALRTGISVEALSRLGFAAEQSGASLATVEKGSKTLARSIFDLGRGLSTQKDAFGEIGLAFKDLQSLSPEKQFIEVAKALSKVENASKRSALAQVLLGRAGQKLLPLFKGGAEGIEALVKEADDLGIVIDAKQAKRAAEFTDQLNRMSRVLQKGIIEVGDAVAPIFTRISEQIVKVQKSVNAWIKDNRGLVQSLLKVALAVTVIGSAIFAFGTVIVGLGITFGIAAAALGAMVSALGLLASALTFIFSPLGVIIALVVALGVTIVNEFNLIEKATKGLLDIFETLKSGFGDAFNTIVNSVKSGNLTGAFQVLNASINVIWRKLILQLVTLWEGFRLSVAEVVVDIAQSFITGFVVAFQTVASAFQKLKNGFLAGFAVIKGGFKKLFIEIVRRVDEFSAKIIEFFDPTQESGIADKVIARNNQIADEKKKAIDNETVQTIRNNSKESGDEIKSIQKATNFRLSLIGKAGDAIRGQAQAGRDAALQLAKSELDLAKAEMAATVDKVRSQNQKQQQTAEDVETAAREAEDPFKRLREAIGDISIEGPGTAVRNRLSARGSFSGLGIESRQPSPAEQESLDKQDQQIVELRKIKENTKNTAGSGRFA